MSMTVISAGPLSTIQDKGRFGYLQYGFSPSGAMDLPAMRMANILVGNAPDDGVIEMTLMGMEVRFDSCCVIAITGGDMSPVLNGEPCPVYRSVDVCEGDVLSFSVAKSGLRTYLAVGGGFDLPMVMNSLSTNLKCKIGGFKGRKLEDGDVIPLRQSYGVDLFGQRALPVPTIGRDEITLRVVLGPQDSMFTQKGIDTFLSCPYLVTAQSDRMGIRLDGESIESSDGVDIISDGIATGSVQIPASGTPIILMSDRQTTGGYAKIATVLSSDLSLLAQARAGTTVRFSAVTFKEARKIQLRAQRYFDRMERYFLLGFKFKENYYDVIKVK